MEEATGVAMGKLLSPALVLVTAPAKTATVWATETLMRG